MHRFRTGFAPALCAARSAALPVLLALGGLLAFGSAQAQTPTKAYEEIARLLGAGQASEAQQQAEARLKERPTDPQLRFLKGVALSQQGQSAEALAVYTALTQDYPELPEPYNNLAVLYANQGRLEEARTALETALRLSPGYATAHQNLGDVYAQLAKLAYDRALELEPGNPTLRPKLQILNQLPTAPAAR